MYSPKSISIRSSLHPSGNTTTPRCDFWFFAAPCFQRFEPNLKFTSRHGPCYCDTPCPYNRRVICDYCPISGPSLRNQLSAPLGIPSRDITDGLRLQAVAHRRVVDQLESQKSITKTRKRHICRKCNIEKSLGSQKVDNCRNPCQDCKAGGLSLERKKHKETR